VASVVVVAVVVVVSGVVVVVEVVVVVVGPAHSNFIASQQACAVSNVHV
jgi:hypothetical protein